MQGGWWFKSKCLLIYGVFGQMTSGVLILGSLGLSLYTRPKAHPGGTGVGSTHWGRANWLGDPFLQEEPSPLGEVFGWIMAGIYMGGRFPQIWLNVPPSPLPTTFFWFFFGKGGLHQTLQ